MTTRLLLAGGGHAHLGVLAAFAGKPMPGLEVTLVSPFPRQVYSGMLPGWVAGHYEIDGCVVPLAPLAQRAGARFELAHVARLSGFTSAPLLSVAFRQETGTPPGTYRRRFQGLQLDDE